jgi:hypothetical protein
MSASSLLEVLGPRVSPQELAARGPRYAAPTVVLALARVLLLVSIFFPYWSMELEAPQYPKGLFVTAYVNTLTGDIAEIDGLNHYIGMRKLEDAAHLERATAIWLVVAMFLLMEGAASVHSRWAVLLVVPVILFPFGFIADLQYWLYSHGQNLDPVAPLSASVKPFTPPALGLGEIGQFRTWATLESGWWLACASSAMTVVGLVLHRRAYKPLHDAAMAQRQREVVVPP